MLSYCSVPDDAKSVIDLAFRFRGGRDGGCAVTGDRHRLLPTGSVELVYRFLRDGLSDERELVLASVTSAPRTIMVPLEVGYVGVRLQPYAVPLLFDQPPAGLVGRRLEARLLGAAFSRLADELAILDPADLLDHLMSGLQKIAAQRRRELPRPELIDMFDRCARGHATFPVKDLNRRAGCGERTVRRQFINWIGLPPKTLIRIGRCNGVSDRILNSDTPLAELAAMFNFSDQAHLTRELKNLHGVTPARLRTCGPN